MADRCVRVTLDEVTLKLTLTSKLLKKSFEAAVLLPFLKAHAQRTGRTEPLAVAALARVEIDSVMLGDASIPAAVVLLQGETVDVTLHLRGGSPSDAASVVAAAAGAGAAAAGSGADPFGGNPFGGNPFGGAPPLPAQPEQLVDFDGKTEVERLKEQRRAARIAREEAAAAAESSTAEATEATEAAESSAGGGHGSGGGATATAEGALRVGETVEVHGLTSDVGRQLNGKRGVLLRFLTDKARWEVVADSVVSPTQPLAACQPCSPPPMPEVKPPPMSYNLKAENLRRVQGAPLAPQGLLNALAAGVDKPAEPAAPAEGAAASVEASLAASEAEAEAVRSRLAASLAAAACVDTDDVEAAEELEGLDAAAAEASVAIGRLEALVDALELEGLSEEAKAAARAKRKALSARLGGELTGALGELRAKVAALRG